MEPKEFDIPPFPRGDTVPISFDLTDKNGNPLNLDDVEIYFTVKKNYNKSDYVIQKRYSIGDIEINGTKASFILEHNDTAELKYGEYVYDIEFLSGDYVKTILRGIITLTEESTHKSNE